MTGRLEILGGQRTKVLRFRLPDAYRHHQHTTSTLPLNCIEKWPVQRTNFSYHCEIQALDCARGVVVRLVIEKRKKTRFRSAFSRGNERQQNVTPKGDWPEELFSQIALELNEKSPCD